MVRRLAITVRGIVQGVGFRPFVWNVARGGKLAGWVKNQVDAVQIEVEGENARLDAFLDALRNRHPPQTQITSLEVTEKTCLHDRAETFQILPSDVALGDKKPRPCVPADLAICGQCLREIDDPQERRYAYPFTNCTNCGPRWSIIERLPYDRPHTSMASFAMCPDCLADYSNPRDRRFHAQPIACPRCGPTLKLLDGGGREAALGDEALRGAVGAVLAGRIVAVKGLGGFQLLADATNAETVALLRQRKRRPDRPFALMVPSLAEARRHCEVSHEEARLLTSHQAPIVLLRRRPAADCAVADACQEVVASRRARQPLPGPDAALHAAASSAAKVHFAADYLHERQSVGRTDGDDYR